MSDIEIGEFNIEAVLLNKVKNRQPSGAIKEEWVPERTILVSIQEERTDGKFVEFNDTDLQSMTVVMWDEPVRMEQRLEIDGIRYEIKGIKVLQRNYYKQITMTQYVN